VGERQDANNAGGVRERVTIAEAATLLGVHPNTVRNRVKAGTYRAEKVVTERGPTWMIDRDSLTTNAPPSDSQQLVGRVPHEAQAALQVLAREIVREAGIAQDPAREAELAGNKLALEAARTQVIVAAGLLVGMAAVVGILPGGSLASPLLYIAFALVLISIFAGISAMYEIATRTSRSEGLVGGWWTWGSSAWFIVGLSAFITFVLLNSPMGSAPGAPSGQLSYWLVVLGAGIVGWLASLLLRAYLAYLSGRRQPERQTPATGWERPSERPWWRRMFGG
jgi:hypothetical protein